MGLIPIVMVSFFSREIRLRYMVSLPRHATLAQEQVYQFTNGQYPPPWYLDSN